MNLRKIIREEVTDFDWASETPAYTPIEDNKHLYNIMSSIIRKPKNYDGWEVGMDDMSGTVYWENPDIDGWVMATPMWTEDTIIPVDYASEDRDYENLGTLTTPNFRYVEEAEKWYEEEYYKKVKDLIDITLQDVIDYPQ